MRTTRLIPELSLLCEVLCAFISRASWRAKMRKHNDITGCKSGLLTATKRVGTYSNGEPLYECLCECGNTTIVYATRVRNGLVKSCGCLKGNHKHGRAYSSEYRIWRAMRDRCYNSKNQDFHRYGGRGISVCERWQDFEAFFADMGERPSTRHSIDRIDNDKGYYKENCRWATPIEQSRNTRSNKMVSFLDKTQCVAAWAEEFCIPDHKLRHRLAKSSCVEQSMSEMMELT